MGPSRGISGTWKVISGYRKSHMSPPTQSYSVEKQNKIETLILHAAAIGRKNIENPEILMKTDRIL